MRKKVRFLSDFKAAGTFRAYSFAVVSNSGRGSVLTGTLRRLSEPRSVLDNPNKLAVGSGQGAGSGAFKSTEVQVDLGLSLRNGA